MNLHSGETCRDIKAKIGRYMNHTRLDAPKCNKKFSFCALCSYSIVVRSSYSNQIIIRVRKTIISQPGQVWYSSMSSIMSTSVWKRCISMKNETVTNVSFYLLYNDRSQYCVRKWFSGKIWLFFWFLFPNRHVIKYYILHNKMKHD